MMRLTWSIWLIVSIVWTFNTFANAFCMFEEKNVCITPSAIAIGTGLAEALMSIVSLMKRWQTDKICFPNFWMRIGFGCISNHFTRFLIKKKIRSSGIRGILIRCPSKLSKLNFCWKLSKSLRPIEFEIRKINESICHLYIDICMRSNCNRICIQSKFVASMDEMCLFRI